MSGAQKQPLHIEDVLREKGLYVSTTVGVSMYPMLRDRRDTIMIRPMEGRLKKYDVPLYRRGEAYVLHRIVKVLPDSYVICGDNCLEKEYGIREEQIIGVLAGFCRDGKQVNMEGIPYRLYVRIWVFLYPVRVCWKRLRGAAVRVKRRLSGKR